MQAKVNYVLTETDTKTGKELGCAEPKAKSDEQAPKQKLYC